MKQNLVRITFFTISLRKGGAENQLVRLVVSLKRKGYDVTIVSFIPGNDFETIIKEESIDHICIPIKGPLGIFKLFRYIKKKRPEILVTFMFAANLIGRLIKLGFGIPLITSVRNNEISAFYRRLYKWTYKIDNLTTFNSEYALKKFINEGLSIQSKSLLMPNAIKIDTFSSYKNRINNTIFTLVSIAHFRPQKDYKTLFEAIKLIKEKGANIKLIVLGHLFDQTWPQEALAKLGIEEQVDLIGFTNDTQQYIDQADGLVLSSLWEGTPNAILEGMANRLPIIASAIPGSSELIKNTQGGFLFEKQDVSDLAEKLLVLSRISTVEKEAMGERGYSHVLANYEETKVHEKWERAIQGLMNG